MRLPVFNLALLCALAPLACSTAGDSGHDTDGHTSTGEHSTGSKGFAGLPCDDCLAAVTAALPTPEPAVEPAAYSVSRIEHVAVRRWAPQLARAPPRPPGQGPPLT